MIPVGEKSQHKMIKEKKIVNLSSQNTETVKMGAFCSLYISMLFVCSNYLKIFLFKNGSITLIL